MRAPVQLSDPGGEVLDAPFGSEDWAKRVRLNMQAAVRDLHKTPQLVRQYVELVRENRVWTLLNRRDGSRFATFEEFCEAEYPWGLGKPYREIEPFLEAAIGRRALHLVTVAPSAQGERTDIAKTSRDECGKSGERKAQALRAILRAPEPAQDLYREGLLGQKEAAKLGPKNPTPEEAARVTEVARAVATEAKAAPKPKAEPDRLALQRRLNTRTRQLLGEDVDDQVAKLLRTIARLADVDRARLLEALLEQYPNHPKGSP